MILVTMRYEIKIHDDSNDNVIDTYSNKNVTNDQENVNDAIEVIDDTWLVFFCENDESIDEATVINVETVGEDLDHKHVVSENAGYVIAHHVIAHHVNAHHVNAHHVIAPHVIAPLVIAPHVIALDIIAPHNIAPHVSVHRSVQNDDVNC